MANTMSESCWHYKRVLVASAILTPFINFLCIYTGILKIYNPLDVVCLGMISAILYAMVTVFILCENYENIPEIMRESDIQLLKVPRLIREMKVLNFEAVIKCILEEKLDKVDAETGRKTELSITNVIYDLAHAYNCMIDNRWAVINSEYSKYSKAPGAENMRKHQLQQLQKIYASEKEASSDKHSVDSNLESFEFVEPTDFDLDMKKKIIKETAIGESNKALYSEETVKNYHGLYMEINNSKQLLSYYMEFYASYEEYGKLIVQAADVSSKLWTRIPNDISVKTSLKLDKLYEAVIQDSKSKNMFRKLYNLHNKLFRIKHLVNKYLSQHESIKSQIVFKESVKLNMAANMILHV